MGIIANLYVSHKSELENYKEQKKSDTEAVLKLKNLILK